MTVVDFNIQWHLADGAVCCTAEAWVISAERHFNHVQDAVVDFAVVD